MVRNSIAKLATDTLFIYVPTALIPKIKLTVFVLTQHNVLNQKFSDFYLQSNSSFKTTGYLECKSQVGILLSYYLI